MNRFRKLALLGAVLVSISSLLAGGALAVLPGTASAQSSMALGLYDAENTSSFANVQNFPVKPHYAISYYAWQENLATSWMASAQAYGVEPFIEMQTCGSPCGATNNTVSLVDVANGMYDSYLTSFAQGVAAFGSPVLLTFDHEMNGNWYPWGYRNYTPAQWIAAWQHVYDVMHPIAPNISFVWAPNINNGARSLVNYWPGSGYVQYAGLDGYFWHATDTFGSVFSPSIAAVESLTSAPLFIAETGATSDQNTSMQPSDVTALWNSAEADNLAGVFYFDKNEGMGEEWQLQTFGLTALEAECPGSACS
jgi:beta-mannanase